MTFAQFEERFFQADGDIAICDKCGEGEPVEVNEGRATCDDCQPAPIPCGQCGKPTHYDDTYGDLCYRCCRADNE